MLEVLESVFLLMARPRRLCVSAERSGGHADPFDITERVEMGQMASMFFNKGNFLPLPAAPHLTSHLFN